MHLQVKPELLRWACARSRIDTHVLHTRFPKLASWEEGKSHPTLKQLEAFANATHVAFGCLFLPDPPEEPLPIADFRERRPGPPSGELLDTLYAAQRRQDWYQDYATTERLDALEWIGSASIDMTPADVASRLRRLLRFEVESRREYPGWESATKALIDRVQELGVLVSISGIVGSNTQRRLDPDEFRGFSLVDRLAPFVFINGADHKAAQAFTLCHELAHLVLGCSGLSNEDLGFFRTEPVETWCDAVASEILAPSQYVGVGREDVSLSEQARALTRKLRVSPLVAVRRVAERSKLPEHVFSGYYQTAFAALPSRAGKGGGNFYATMLRRVGHRFARDVIASTLEGNTTFSEAFRLLGVRNSAAFGELSRRVGLI